MSPKPLLMVVDDKPSVLLLVDVLAEKMVTFMNHLREMARLERMPVIAMSTAAVLERCGDTLQVADTLLKPITQPTLAHALDPYR
jgi:response regulator of citrate/malate metabolism